MIGIYAMIVVQPGEMKRVIGELRDFENVEDIAVITGEYDIIVKASLETLDELADLTDRINQIKGIRRTHTHIVQREFSV